jgi:hypothetical protein
MNLLPRGRRTQAFSRLEVLTLVACVTVWGGLALSALGSARDKSQRLVCLDRLGEIGRGFRAFAGDFGDRYPNNVSTNEYPNAASEYVPSGTVATNLLIWTSFRALSNHLASPAVFVCPSDTGRRGAGRFDLMGAPQARNACISYGVGVETGPSTPGMLLAADRSLEGGFPRLRFDQSSVGGILATNAQYLDTLEWNGFGMHRSAGNVLRADGSASGLSSAGLRLLLLRSGDPVNRYFQPGRSASE